MPTDPSFQMTIQDIVPIGVKIAYLGEIERGTLCIGDEVYIRGRGAAEKVVVMSIETSNERFSQVYTGAFVVLSLRAINKQKVKGLKIGDVLLGLNSKTSQKKIIDFKTDILIDNTKWHTHRDKKHNFEIDIPPNWSVYKNTLPVEDISFTNGPNEIFNIVVETMSSWTTPSFTERLFRLHAQDMQFINCEYGTITVGKKAHTWSRYQVESKIWSKKYMIILGGNGYAITASCDNHELFLRREKLWDTIATSLRLLA